MKQTVFDVLTRLIEIAWRRRVLVSVPLLIMGAASLLGTRFLPDTYVAKALLALQENGSDSPLGQNQESSDRNLKDRAPGLQALLKSDRVLVNALRDTLGDGMPTDPRRVAAAVARLDKQLSIEMIGNTFLELQLSGSDPHGLGRQLQAVTSRFLESLVSPDQDALSATQVVLERRRAEVATTEKALLLFKQQLGERTLAAIAASTERLQSQQANTQALVTGIGALDGEIATLRSALAGFAAPENSGRREIEIRQSLAMAETADAKRSAAALAEAQAARQRAAQLTRLQALEIRGALARRELDAGAADIASQSRASLDARSPAGQLRHLEQNVVDARAALDATAKRFPTAGANQGLQVLNAPERIRVIDAPKDPEFPSTSPLKLIVAGLLAGLLSACGLVAIAEMLDQNLRHPAEFEAAAGVPVIARLPPALPDSANPQPVGAGPMTGPTDPALPAAA